MKRRMSDTQKEVMHTNTNHSPTETNALSFFSVFGSGFRLLFYTDPIRIRIQAKIYYDKIFNEINSFTPFSGANFGLPGSGSTLDFFLETLAFYFCLGAKTRDLKKIRFSPKLLPFMASFDKDYRSDKRRFQFKFLDVLVKKLILDLTKVSDPDPAP
jgi:hypothetical protein